MSILYQVLNPAGSVLGTGVHADGIALFVRDNILILDDHAKYSVATYRESVVMRGKATLEVQVSAEDFYQQVLAILDIEQQIPSTAN